MKANIDVADRKEADAIRTALDDPIVRASVVIYGTLSPLDENARRRVINFVCDKFNIPIEWPR